jgi:Protein of unknown function (DUF3617)
MIATHRYVCLLACLGVAYSQAISSPSADQNPKAGLWQSTTAVIDIQKPGWARAEAEALLKQFEQPAIASFCFDGRKPWVGKQFLGETCEWTRIDDAGDKVSRSAVCGSAVKDDQSQVSDLDYTGSQSTDAYVHDVVTTHRDSTGQAGTRITTREVGKWLGPC